MLMLWRHFAFDRILRGYHAYMDIWSPKVGDQLISLRRDPENVIDVNAVSVLTE